jgi:hypothetical protein
LCYLYIQIRLKSSKWQIFGKLDDLIIWWKSTSSGTRRYWEDKRSTLSKLTRGRWRRLPTRVMRSSIDITTRLWETSLNSEASPHLKQWRPSIWSSISMSLNLWSYQEDSLKNKYYGISSEVYWMTKMIKNRYIPLLHYSWCNIFLSVLELLNHQMHG